MTTTVIDDPSTKKPIEGESVDTTKQGEDRKQFEDIVRNVVGQKEAEIGRLTRELAAAKAVPDKPSEPLTYDKFVENPGVLENMMEAVVRRVMAPALEETGLLKKNRVFEDAKNSLIAQSPGIAVFFDDPQFLSVVRQNAMTQNEVNANTLHILATSLAGQIAINKPEEYQRITNRKGSMTTKDTTTRMDTPSVSSSTPDAPKKGDDAVKPWNKMSDNEVMAAKWLNKSPEEYWNMLHTSAQTDIDELRKTKVAK